MSITFPITFVGDHAAWMFKELPRGPTNEIGKERTYEWHTNEWRRPGHSFWATRLCVITNVWPLTGQRCAHIGGDDTKKSSRVRIQFLFSFLLWGQDHAHACRKAVTDGQSWHKRKRRKKEIGALALMSPQTQALSLCLCLCEPVVDSGA